MVVSLIEQGEPRTAIGYVPAGGGRWRSNVFHLPVRGVGDGGAYTTVADLSNFWRALFARKIVPARWVAEMVRPRNDEHCRRCLAGAQHLRERFSA